MERSEGFESCNRSANCVLIVSVKKLPTDAHDQANNLRLKGSHELDAGVGRLKIGACADRSLTHSRTAKTGVASPT
jgi:hypothetical protein